MLGVEPSAPTWAENAGSRRFKDRWRTSGGIPWCGDSAPSASGDAYFLLWGPDRELLVPDAARRNSLWTSRVWPGALGEAVRESGLTPLEHDVIAAFLQASHPVMDALREQFAACRVAGREFTGVGFYTHLDVPERLAVPGFEHLPLSDINAEIEGVPHGAGFILWVIDGLLNELEGFVYDGSWPEHIDRYEVISTADTPGWRNTPTDLESVSHLGPVGVYVRLLGQGTAMYRPVEAERIDRVTAKLSIPAEDDPEVARWEFQPGTIVGLTPHTFDDGVDGWLAVPLSEVAQ